MHGADYDLRLLRRVGFAGPERMFDTMIAARLCGVPEFSLAALIERYFRREAYQGFAKGELGAPPAFAADGRLRGERHALPASDSRRSSRRNCSGSVAGIGSSNRASARSSRRR